MMRLAAIELKTELPACRYHEKTKDKQLGMLPGGTYIFPKTGFDKIAMEGFETIRVHHHAESARE